MRNASYVMWSASLPHMNIKIFYRHPSSRSESSIYFDYFNYFRYMKWLLYGRLRNFQEHEFSTGDMTQHKRLKISMEFFHILNWQDDASVYGDRVRVRVNLVSVYIYICSWIMSTAQFYHFKTFRIRRRIAFARGNSSVKRVNECLMGFWGPLCLSYNRWQRQQDYEYEIPFEMGK